MRERKRSRAERARAASRTKRRVILFFTIGLAILGALSIAVFGRAGFGGAVLAALGVAVGALYLWLGERVERASDELNRWSLTAEAFSKPWAEIAGIAILIWIVIEVVRRMWFE